MKAAVIVPLENISASQIIPVCEGCCPFRYNLGWFLIIEGEKGNYQGELFEHVALAVDVVPAIWRTSRWSMTGTARPGRDNFRPFSTMQNSETNVARVAPYVGVRWTFWIWGGSLIIWLMCDISWLIGTDGERKWGTGWRKNPETTETNADGGKQCGCWTSLSFVAWKYPR